MSTEGSTRAIVAALLANAGIAVAKFVGYLITGSSSMLAESVHSVADTSNQGLLLFGQRQAKKEADSLHPFGYGRARYFYSFVVALGLWVVMRRLFKVGGTSLSGMLAGTQTQPAVLAFANHRTGFDSRVALGYALVYPAAMITKIVLGGLLGSLA